jgi:hypothetical protein
MALAAAAFGQGAFFSTVQWFAVALIALAFAVALAARVLPVADLRTGFVLASIHRSIRVARFRLDSCTRSFAR